MPSQKDHPYRSTYTSEIQEKCMLTFADPPAAASVLESVMANHYSDNDNFAKFTGVNLIPENHHLFPTFGTPFHETLDATKVPPGTIRAATCETVNDDGTRWTVTRLGPFITTGGYDWTQVGWENLWDLSAKLKEYPEGIYAVEQFSGAVSKDGTRISNPPIHIHHIHIGPQPGIRQRRDNYACVKFGKDCYDPTRVFEHHGDYQDLASAPGEGLDILQETIPEGYGKFLDFPLGLEGDINDERAPNSPPLEWYYQLGVRWVPYREKNGEVSKILPINFHNFAGPGNYKKENQHSYIFTYQSPTDLDSLYWYTGRMPFSGEMLRNKFHAHNKIFKEGIFFAATPEELGLTPENKLKLDYPFKTIDINAAGFESHDEVKKFIFAQLEQSGKEYDERVAITGNSGYNLIQERYSRDRPRAVCQGIGRLEEVDGYFYDRREPTCCVPWTIQEGDIFTVVGFNRKLVDAIGPSWTQPQNPATFPGHVGWWLSVASLNQMPPKSEFGIGMYAQEPNEGFHPGYATPEQLFAVFAHGGTTGRINFLHRNILLPFAVLIFRNPLMGMMGALILFILSIRWCFFSSQRSKASTKSVVDSPSCPDPEALVASITTAVTYDSELELQKSLKSI
jgi:hypothetical protein